MNYYYDLYRINTREVFLYFESGKRDRTGYPKKGEGTISGGQSIPRIACSNVTFNREEGYRENGSVDIAPGQLFYKVYNVYGPRRNGYLICMVLNTFTTNAYGTKLYEYRIDEVCEAKAVTRTEESQGTLLRADVVLSDSYPRSGIANVPGHGRVWVVRKGTTNALPVISGADQNLGAKNDEFSVSYSVSDADAANQLTVTESLNGQTLRNLTNAPRGQLQTITINREKLYALSVGTTNTIEVKVDDGAGGVAYRRWTFTRTNTAPQISGSDSDLGIKTQGFTVHFSATDQENDPMSARVYLDDVVLKDFGTIHSGEEYTITFDKLGFAKIKHGEVHKLRIEVRDKNNATSVRNYTFIRALDRMSYTFKKETDKKVAKAFITPTWVVAEGAIAKVEVCNNAKDAAPTWENMTTQVLEGRHFNLQNTIKTADQWMFGVKITVERGQAKENSWLGGFGGGY